ncbi:3159_t:CDS:2, partial [Gigaspora margarita]
QQRHEKDAQECEPTQRAIAQQLRQAHDLESNTQYNRNEYERVEYKRSEHERAKYEISEHERVEHERSEYELSKHEQNEYERNNHKRSKYKRSKHKKNISKTSKIQKNTTNIPNKRSIAQQARRERERIKRTQIQLDSTISEQSQNNNIRHYLGRMDSECTQCKALYWLDERLTISSRTRPKHEKCCNQEK